MVEARKCARCGCMYISETEVCGKCQKKDGAELYRLKGFLNQGIGEDLTQGELSIATGISNKNLSRFLGYDEFKGIVNAKGTIAASGEINQEKEELIELV